MTKEDYMKLSKERLAELLAERDSHSPFVMPNIPFIPNDYIPNDPRPLCGYGGYCTNKFRDCVGCPGVYYPTGTRTITTISNTELKQE